jgi:hypothetical protein
MTDAGVRKRVLGTATMLGLSTDGYPNYCRTPSFSRLHSLPGVETEQGSQRNLAPRIATTHPERVGGEVPPLIEPPCLAGHPPHGVLRNGRRYCM